MKFVIEDQSLIVSLLWRNRILTSKMLTHTEAKGNRHHLALKMHFIKESKITSRNHKKSLKIENLPSKTSQEEVTWKANDVVAKCFYKFSNRIPKGLVKPLFNTFAFSVTKTSQNRMLNLKTLTISYPLFLEHWIFLTFQGCSCIILIQMNDAIFLETSARTGENVRTMIDMIAR